MRAVSIMDEISSSKPIAISSSESRETRDKQPWIDRNRRTMADILAPGRSDKCLDRNDTLPRLNQVIHFAQTDIGRTTPIETNQSGLRHHGIVVRSVATNDLEDHQSITCRPGWEINLLIPKN